MKFRNMRAKERILQASNEKEHSTEKNQESEWHQTRRKMISNLDIQKLSKSEEDILKHVKLQKLYSLTDPSSGSYQRMFFIKMRK